MLSGTGARPGQRKIYAREINVCVELLCIPKHWLVEAMLQSLEKSTICIHEQQVNYDSGNDSWKSSYRYNQ